ncbi:LLM class flavin-dependent oxidoreductase [Gordonia crocea]|uniref:Monooxygenase n=1 Tax=Gordonia crocea TaxID=589162 RepID=A0A7I9UW31_9ACTN|nr:LLM class flavin-dependent oxidoreductase [Gordonia crocea]GED97152.1 monooxygenase [Gordonia crocea]
MSARRQMALNAFIFPPGHHEAAWRYDKSQPERIYDADYYQQIALAAEAAKFDAVFFADSPSLNGAVEFNAAGRLDPLLTLMAIASVTERIGLIATASTTYSQPYNLARAFASLDHLSHGRAGWNIVTTDSAAAGPNFGVDHPDPTDRYERAREFVDIVTALWDSWEEEAVLLDKAAGRYADPDKIHRVDIRGRLLASSGPLNVPRTPQGQPVLVQAGASNEGRDFAAAHAEVIFTAQRTLADARRFYSAVKAQAAQRDRDPDQVLILPGISPFIGSTQREADELEQRFNELTVPAYGIRQIASITGEDVSGLDLDAPVPASLFADAGDVTDNRRSRRQVVAGIVERDKPTLRTLLHRLAGARGHRVIAGTPERVADELAEWFLRGGADGFNVMPPYFPGGLTDFTEQVVPILVDRGLFRRDYTGTTLREHLGLRVPENRFTRARSNPPRSDLPRADRRIGTGHR